MRSTFLISAALVLIVAAPVDASDCATWSTSDADVTADLAVAGEGTYYVDDTTCSILWCVGQPASMPWLYEESNGIAGLQRGDEIRDDTCHGAIQPDTIIF